MTTATFPLKDAIARRGDLLVTLPWVNWLTQLQTTLDTAPSRLTTIALETQDASIGVTALSQTSLAAGLYLASWRARITRAATTSSSLTVTISSTESGVSLSESGAAITGNTTATVQSDRRLLRVDQGTPISYSTTYASVGATSMQYRLDLVLERIDT